MTMKNEEIGFTGAQISGNLKPHKNNTKNSSREVENTP